jgi:hypothetical protein
VPQLRAKSVVSKAQTGGRAAACARALAGGVPRGTVASRQQAAGP